MCSCIECIGDHPEPTAEDLEQAAFEKWLRDKCPSGDVESVQRQWLESYEYAELLDEQAPEWQLRLDCDRCTAGRTQVSA